MVESGGEKEIDKDIDVVTLPIRREILKIIADSEAGKTSRDFEPTIYKIAKHLGETNGNISYHVQKLVSEGLLKEREKPDRKKRRYKTYYSLTKTGHKSVVDWADEYILPVLPSFKIEKTDIKIDKSFFEKYSTKAKKIKDNAFEEFARNMGLNSDEAELGFFVLYAKDKNFRWWINFAIRGYKPSVEDSRFESWDEYLFKIFEEME